MSDRAGHVREVLTGFRSGTAELAHESEPREGYDPATSLNTRYAVNAAELRESEISVHRWVRASARTARPV